MKTQMLGLAGLAATAVLAAPGGHGHGHDHGCEDYSYSPSRCPSCPFNHHDHGHHELLDFDFGESCHRECPKEHRECFRFKKNYHESSRYELDFHEEFSCHDNYRFHVRARFESCSHHESSSCLNVNFGDHGHRGHGNHGFNEAFFGLYLDDHHHHDPHHFNFNNHCHGNSCSIPSNLLPHDLCGKDVFLGFNNDRCFSEHHDHHDSSFVKVRISCNDHHHEDHCEEYCCCPGGHGHGHRH